MRTSRVHAVTSSIFRNERQYLQSNELFHRVMSDGNGQTPNKRQQQRNDKQGNEQKQNPARVIQKNNNSKRKVREQLPLDTETMLDMQNRMLQHSTEIKDSINRKVRMHTYRTSI